MDILLGVVVDGNGFGDRVSFAGIVSHFGNSFIIFIYIYILLNQKVLLVSESGSVLSVILYFCHLMSNILTAVH